MVLGHKYVWEIQYHTLCTNEKIKVLVGKRLLKSLWLIYGQKFHQLPCVCFPATSLPLDNNIIFSSAQHLCGQCSRSQWKTFKWGEDSKLPRTESDGGCLTTEIQQNAVVPARNKSCLTSTYNVSTGEEGGKEERPSFLPPESLHGKTKKRKEMGYTASP